MRYSPAATTVLNAGDHLIVMGEPSRLREIEVLAGGGRK
jgi:K+/H+ antiporter YhaU regulatory subunit KhtT